MAVLGVLTCEILELEFAYLLANDPEIADVTMLEDRYSLGMIEALEYRNLAPRRIPILRGFSSNQPDRLEVLVRVLELALHNRKRFLQEGLTKAAKEMGRYVDAIVLGYGLCGNALQKPEELLVDAGVPIFIPMDQDHPVDDCVGLIIGGRECYYKEQCRVAGTFFMIPGWTRHWKELFKKEYGSFDIEFARRIFGMSNYERSLLIPNPTLPADEMRQNIEEFNQLFGFRTELQQGSLDMLKMTWEKAKQYLQEKTEVHMTTENQSQELIRELRFENGDFFDQKTMIDKLDRLIQAWGEELLRNQYIDKIPDSEYAWLDVLERDIHLKDLDNQWDFYLVGCLIFFVMMREDIRRDFLLQPYNVLGQRLERWLRRLNRYMTPLTRDVVTQFCLCYSLSQERKPIRVRYKEFKE